jgi:hypothetical protein
VEKLDFIEKVKKKFHITIIAMENFPWEEMKPIRKSYKTILKIK